MADTQLPFLGSVAHHVANRVVACKGWRWMPGMLTVSGARVGHVGISGTAYVHGWEEEFGCVVETSDSLDSTALPDFTDAATVGCLLALVREAWGDEYARTWPRRPTADGKYGDWCCVVHRDGDMQPKTFVGTEAEALVAALESAP